VIESLLRKFRYVKEMINVVKLFPIQMLVKETSQFVAHNKPTTGIPMSYNDEQTYIQEANATRFDVGPLGRNALACRYQRFGGTYCLHLLD
jgi:hypothetical protein